MILVTSLLKISKLAQKCVSIYTKRMQIEESFRDMKSHRYGIGFDLHLSYKQERLQTLIMIGMLANLILWMLGTAVFMSGQAKDYQANTEMKRRVLSTIFLGQRVSNDRRFKLKLEQLTAAYKFLVEQIRENGEKC